MPKGYKKDGTPVGRSKGCVPWNVGIKRTKEEIINISNAKICKKLLGEKSQRWKGGIYTPKKGYVYIYSPEHPFCDCRKYVKRSRLVMEKHLGRYLQPEETVHHKGTKYPIHSKENRQDDRIENLQLFETRGEHIKFHKKLRQLNKKGQFMPVNVGTLEKEVQKDGTP